MLSPRLSRRDTTAGLDIPLSIVVDINQIGSHPPVHINQLLHFLLLQAGWKSKAG